MSYIYDKSGQRLFFQREESYGKVYDPESSGITAWTMIPANYAHWRRFDIIPDTLEPILPKIEKIKQYDISDSKHASSIAEGNIEPQEFTISMDAQALEFLPCAIGNPAYSSHGRAAVQTIECVADVSGSLNETYILVDVINTNAVKHLLFWFDVDSGGSAPTSPTGINDSNRIEVDISANDTANTVATALADKLDDQAEITSATVSGGTITVTHANNGAVVLPHNGASSPGFSFGITTHGSTVYTVTEALDTNIPSFTLHLELQNTTSGEDIIYDIFGCVVNEVVVNVGFGDKIVRCDVTFKSPYAVRNTNGRATCPPSRKYIPSMPTMNTLQEADNACLLQSGTTSTVNGTDDRTPQTVERVALTINNNVSFQSDVESQFMKTAIAGKRDVFLNIVGAITETDLLQYWQEKYKLSSSDYIPDSASERLNSVFKLQRDATYDYISIAIYNLLATEHSLKLSNVDEAFYNADMTFEDGDGDSNGRILTSTTIASFIDRTIMLGTQ